MANDAWDPFERLKERIIEVNDPLGLDFITWAVNPDERGIQIVFSIREDAFQTPEEKAEQELLDGIRAATRAQELEDRRNQIVAENLKVTRKGIFNEDSAPEA